MQEGLEVNAGSWLACTVVVNPFDLEPELFL